MSKRYSKPRPLPFEIRRQEAEKWLDHYQNTPPVYMTVRAITKAYHKRFNVNRYQALQELRQLGVPFSEQDEQWARSVVAAQTDQQRAKKRKHKQNPQEEPPHNSCQDDRFFFIAGYTPGGAPYGVTWEEMGLHPYESQNEDEDNT